MIIHYELNRTRHDIECFIVGSLFIGQISWTS